MKYSVRPEPQYNQEVVVLASGVEIGFIYRPEPYSPPVGLAWLSRPVAEAEPGAATDPGRAGARPTRRAQQAPTGAASAQKQTTAKKLLDRWSPGVVLPPHPAGMR